MAARWGTAWVTGASSGIGRELALQLAAAGTRVAISARSADKLDEVARLHPLIRAFPLDVTRREDIAAACGRIVEAIGPIDLAVLNAGVWHPMSATRYDSARAADSMNVNYLGIAHAVEPLVPAMLARGRGHLALVASVAGYRGLPQAAAYAPSKAAVISLAEVLRLELAPRGITVSVVNPGFVETPMTAVNRFPMPYMITAEEAARRIVAGLSQGRFEVAFPVQLVWQLKMLRLLPNSLYFWIASRMVPKE